MRLHLIAILVTGLLAACGRDPVGNTPQAVPAAVADETPTNLEEARAALAAGKREAYERGLRRLAEDGDPVVRRRAAVLLARHIAAISPGEAVRHLDAAVRLYSHDLPRLTPYLQLEMIRLLAAAGNAAAASELAERVAGSATPAARTAAIMLPELVHQAGGDRAAVAQAVERAEQTAVDQWSEDELMRAAKRLDELQLTESARRLRWHLLTSYPQGRYVEDLYDAMVRDAGSPLHSLPSQQALALADKLGRRNRYDQALDLLRRIAERDSSAAASADYRYLLATARFNSRRYEEVITANPQRSEPYFLATQLLRARAYWRLDQNEEFLRLTQEIIRNAPESKEAGEARLLLGRYYIIDANDPERSVAYLKEAVASGNLGRDGETLWTIAWTHIAARQYDAALQAMDQYLKRFPDADYTSNALFWTGKIQLETGNRAAADATFRRLIDFYPYAYYSYRAREILGAAAPVPAAATGSFPAEVTVAGSDVVEELIELGLIGEAALETAELASAATQERYAQYLLADLYSRAGQTLAAIVLLNRHFRDVIRHGGTNVPRRFWEILYPLPYRDEIERNAAARGLDPFFIAAIIKQESGFMPATVSSAGAVGLMQIMPNEAERIARAGGLPSPGSRRALFDPATNIALGAAEFIQKRELMDGNTLLAIASYNAGEHAVSRWLARTPLSDVDRFIDSIPFNETRLYVKNVTRNHYEYRRIYGSADGP